MRAEQWRRFCKEDGRGAWPRRGRGAMVLAETNGRAPRSYVGPGAWLSALNSDVSITPRSAYRNSLHYKSTTTTVQGYNYSNLS